MFDPGRWPKDHFWAINQSFLVLETLLFLPVSGGSLVKKRLKMVTTFESLDQTFLKSGI